MMHVLTFCQEFASKFYITYSSVERAAEEFWKQKESVPDSTSTFLEDMAVFITTVCTSNLITPSEDHHKYVVEYWSKKLTAESLEKSFQALTILSKEEQDQVERIKLEACLKDAVSKKKKIEPKNNKCKALLKSGPNKGNECGKSCSGEFCATHAPKAVVEDDEGVKKKAKFVPQEMDLAEEKTVPIPTAAEVVNKMKRQMKKKAPNRGQITEQLISSRVNAVHFYKNNWGRYENTNTGFVYDPAIKRIYGKQMMDGVVAPLTLNDIEHCKDLMIDYVLPTKLGEVVAEREVEHSAEDDYEEIDDDDEDAGGDE